MSLGFGWFNSNAAHFLVFRSIHNWHCLLGISLKLIIVLLSRHDRVLALAAFLCVVLREILRNVLLNCLILENQIHFWSGLCNEAFLMGQELLRLILIIRLVHEVLLNIQALEVNRRCLGHMKVAYLFHRLRPAKLLELIVDLE